MDTDNTKQPSGAMSQVPQPKNKSRKPGMAIRLKEISANAEYQAIMHILIECNYNKCKAALMLGIDRKTLYNKLRTYSQKFTLTVNIHDRIS